MSDPRFSPKAPAEKIVLTFDFTNLLEAGEILTAAVSVGVSVSSGVDSNPQRILADGAAIDLTGKKWLQPIVSGSNGADYRLSPLMDTSNPLKRIGFSAVLPVRD